jgi:hypothetical protein
MAQLGLGQVLLLDRAEGELQRLDHLPAGVDIEIRLAT